MASAEFLWLVVLGCSLATFVWRGLGVLVVRRIDPDGAFFKWVACVSYAMVAGLIFRMLTLPGSDLAQISLPLRLAAVAIAFAAYYLSGRRLVAGVVAGGMSIAAMAQWLG